MSVIVKLKGPWSPNGTDEDKCHSCFKDEDRIRLYDNDYGLNGRWYPIENVARVDEKK